MIQACLKNDMRKRSVSKCCRIFVLCRPLYVLLFVSMCRNICFLLFVLYEISLNASECLSFQSSLFCDFVFAFDSNGLSGSEILARFPSARPHARTSKILGKPREDLQDLAKILETLAWNVFSQDFLQTMENGYLLQNNVVLTC